MPREWNRWLGRTIDNRFALREYLGGTEASGVFLTPLDSAPSQKAAIKLVVADPAKTQAQLSLWALVKKLSNPHLIRLFETGQCSLGEETFLYCVMEYAEENLSMILPTRALTPAETKEMLLPALDALACIHRHGFVHGHIKPSNIMAVSEQVKISSDGITPAGRANHLSAERNRYLPPEASTGQLTPAADVWSLGVTIAEVLTQRMPSFDGRNIVPPALPSPFRNIVDQCLRPDPQQRCTIADIQKQLHPPAVPEHKTVAANPPKPLAKRRFPVLALIGVLLAILLGVFLVKHRNSSPEAAEQTTQTQISPPSPQAEQNPATNSSSPGKVVRRVLPDVSKNALHTIHGTIKVRLRVFVDAAGGVERVRMESPGPSRYFESKSLDAAKQWKFEAPSESGKAVASEWNLEFRFNQTSSNVRELRVHQ
ncbi:MAG: TonB family protein [Terriglobales bacterium]